MQLHYEAHGQGPPLVILHGLFGSLENWHSISRRLADSFHVVAVDQRNHGHSPHSADMNYPLMAADVLQLLQRLRLTDIGLLGHSMGGKTAMQLALLHPELVRKLIVVDISPRSYSPRHERIFGGLLSLNLSAFHTRQEMEVALAASIPDIATRRFLLKNVARAPAGGFHWKMNLRDIYRNFGRLNEAVSAGAPFTKPTLFIRGGDSDYIREEDIPQIRQLFTQAELQTVPRAGHWVHAAAPEAFLAAALKFLA